MPTGVTGFFLSTAQCCIAPRSAPALTTETGSTSDPLFDQFMDGEAGHDPTHLAYLQRGIANSPMRPEIPVYAARLEAPTTASPEAAEEPAYPRQGETPAIDSTALGFLHSDVCSACVCVGRYDEQGRLHARWCSSAAYPVHLQQEDGAAALAEDMITFGAAMGAPDLTYGWTKLTGEYLARIAAQTYGLHVAVVRPFSGYGEDQEDVYPVPAIAGRAARREDPLVVWGSGRQSRDFVHIDDCVMCMQRALDVISDGSAVNIGSGQATSFLELAALFADIAGYAPEIRPQEDRATGVFARYADVRRAKEVLDWSPRISLREGMARVYEAASRRSRGGLP